MLTAGYKFSVYLIFVSIIYSSEAACPNKATVRNNAVSGGTQLGGRGLHQECCDRRRQCQCNSGLQCCRNFNNVQICLENSCATDCGANGRCVTRNGRSRCECNAGFFESRGSGCVRRSRGASPRSLIPRQRGGIGTILNGFFSPRTNSNGAVGVLLCHQHQCGPGGVCRVVRGQAKCRCNSGFVLNQINNRCEDPNKFTTIPPLEPTQPASPTTRPTNGVRTISIPSPVTTTSAPSTDPRCSSSNNPCGDNQLCTIEFNQVVCQCEPGFDTTRDGVCFRNPCQDNPCGANEGCLVPPGSTEHQCLCLGDLTRNADNECVHALCASTCGRNTDCIVVNQVADCTCKANFFLNSDGHCVNSTCNGLCGDNQFCLAEQGFAVCTCLPGFPLLPTGECLDPCMENPCAANKTCSVDGPNSIKCECSTGFITDANENCVDNPCEPNPCGTGGRCSLVGLGHRCECLAGFLQHNEKCVDNPCEPNPCGAGGTCTVNGTEHTCRCSAGFMLRSNTCLDNPCIPNPCGGGSCSVVDSAFSCECNEGLTQHTDGTCVVPTTQPTTTAVNAPGSATTPPPNPCPSGKSCGAGICSLIDEQEVCTCPPGFRLTNSTCIFTSPCDPAATPSTLQLGDSGTGRISPGTTSGCLKSRNYPSPYTPDLFDEVILPVQGHTTLHITIEHLETRPTGGEPRLEENTCMEDFLFVQGQLLCGHIPREDQPAHRRFNVAGRNSVTLGLVSDSGNEFAGFLLRWSLA